MTKPANVLSAFDASARDYDAERRKLIPHFDLLYGAALDLVHEWGGPPAPRVLDLGAGTGLFADMILEALPDASITLLDGSAGMLGEARARFADEATIEFRVGDMIDADLGEGWDLVISSLAIHHLEHADKRQLLRRVRDALVPGGLFINVEQVAGPDGASNDRYQRMWHRDISVNGATCAQIAAASQRMEFDRCASTEDQLLWMREAGFSEVDCGVKAWRFAVLSGRT